jgi:hypothetical protein
MAINIKDEADKAIIEISNGHLAALKKVVADYKLIGEKEALDFMLSIMSQADGKAINNGKGSFVPSDKLKESPKEPLTETHG